MKLLITGINGFVSKHFLNYVDGLNEKFEILGVGRTENASFVNNYKSLNLKYKCIDLLNKNLVSELLKTFKPNYIIHLASVSSVGLSWEFPYESFVNNTNIFLNLIEELRKEKSNCRILSIGSSEEYGSVVASTLPLQEETPLNPVNPYAVARVSQEMISRIYEKGYDLNIVMTRSFNHIGPGQIDKFVVASFAKQLTTLYKNGQREATIVTGDLSIIRDFVDVRDVVKAYYNLLFDGKKGEIYNICSGKGNSLKEILEQMGAIIGMDITFQTDPKLIRPIENRIIIGSFEKIKKHINWEPEITLQQSLMDIIDWWKKN